MGKELKKGPYTKTTPQEWSKDEVDKLLSLREAKFTLQQISEKMRRSLPSIRYQIKVQKKKNKTYNEENASEKLEFNKLFVEHVKPTTLLDVFAGEQSSYEKLSIPHLISNDKRESSTNTHNKDALKLLCELYADGKKFDVIDLDPYGSAYECFDLAIKMAKKGLVITLGEIGQRRFGRLDFVKSRYGISTLEDLTSDNMIKVIQNIGIQNKKTLTVWRKADWRLTSRVYFTIQRHKITEQWQ